MAKDDSNVRMEKCSFCGKSEAMVHQLIERPGVFICDECVSLCSDLINQHRPSNKTQDFPKDMVIHRMTGDGPRSLLIAPLWSTDKKRVLNTINKRFEVRDTYQGRLNLF